jgi:hypothetical protein
MPLHVNDLQPGDRVVLNCAAGRGRTKREARFQGIFSNYKDALQGKPVLMRTADEEFLACAEPIATFLLQRADRCQLLEYPGGGPLQGIPEFDGERELLGFFRVEPDGALREQQGRRITIEMRVRMGQG